MEQHWCRPTPSTARIEHNQTQPNNTQQNAMLLLRSIRYPLHVPPFQPLIQSEMMFLDGDCSDFERDSSTAENGWPHMSSISSSFLQSDSNSTVPTSSSSSKDRWSTGASAHVQCRKPGCFRQFGCRCDRIRHERNFHSDEKPYQCLAHSIPVRVKEKSKLVDHLESNHNLGRRQGHAMVDRSKFITIDDLLAE